MPIYAKKTLIGYRELEDASAWSLETTHVILTWQEYLDQKDLISALESKLDDAQYQLRQGLQDADQEYREKYRYLKQDLEEQHKKSDQKAWLLHQEEIASLKGAIKDKDQMIDVLKSQLSELDAHIAEQKDLNRNLLRMARERGNQNRGVTPKKAHHGYLFNGSVQAVERIQIPDPNDSWNTVWESKIVWKTTLQTPYSILLDIHTLAITIQNELFAIVLGEMGVNTDIQPINGSYPLDNDKDCIAYRWLYRITRSSYWEIEVWTTAPVIVLEKNLPPQYMQKGEKNDGTKSGKKEMQNS